MSPRRLSESEMARREVTPDRLTVFSDGVFAVIITILVLELRPPHAASFEALLLLWPTAVSYAVSYLFIAHLPLPRRLSATGGAGVRA
jgi:uncharacterized membrane protein